MATKKQDYGNDSISSLKGADRVRKRPGVIFGSDGLDGCEHAVFEILSNSIDEAREGHGRLITVTRYADRSIEVEDKGRGCPVDWNEKEQHQGGDLAHGAADLAQEHIAHGGDLLQALHIAGLQISQRGGGSIPSMFTR